MNTRSTVVLTTLLALMTTVAIADKPALEQVQKEIKAVISAAFVADVETIGKYTHEKVIAMVGDRETFLAEMKKVFQQVEEAGLKLASAEVADEFDYFAGDENEFLLIGTTITLNIGGTEQPPAPGFQLGVKKKSEEGWKYIDCSAMTTALAREWFPDFPKEKEIPETPEAGE